MYGALPSLSANPLSSQPDGRIRAGRRTVRAFRQKFTLENAIEFHGFVPLEALPCVRPMSFFSGEHFSYQFTL
jgi:hypothetical protein